MLSPSFRVLCLLVPVGLLLLNPILQAAPPSRVEVDLAGPGWTLRRDLAADWRNEEIYLPGTPLEKIAVHPPTDGWKKLGEPGAVAASVPGTTEEYFHQDLDLSKIVKPRRPASPLEGVTWWSRSFKVPDVAGPRRFLLRFGSVRLRAEVFINHQLAGYDLVGDTPFSVDITDLVKPGQTVDLDVRVTNPGGCLDWTDTEQIKWGAHVLPDGHSFSGITGDVKLEVLSPVHVDDLWIANTPNPREVTVSLDLRNTTAGAVERDVAVEVFAMGETGSPVFQRVLKGVKVPPGNSLQTLKIAVPAARLWSLSAPNLYVCRARVLVGDVEEDAFSRNFGFRSFTLDDIGRDARLRLNGDRVFLLTAISWGYWPVTGLIPTPAMAAKQVSTAKELGLNMLNFHRCIGSPVVLDEADRQGLLYFEEPGGYVTGGADPFAQALAREKLLRMVRRDRSHPSLIIYNMINEQWDAFGADKKPAVYDVAKRDMRDAHEADPSRLFVYSSAWARKPAGTEELPKLHMRPYDSAQYQSGWWDFHRAGGPTTYQQTSYVDPDHHYGYSANRGEVVYWGEEGAVSSPPRLALIKKAIDESGKVGWDGATYLDWHAKFVDFMARKKLTSAFGSLDDFTLALSAVSFENQGRKIEDTRVCDVNDGYAINGWEAMVFDNHSGIVDCYRNPKGDPSLIARSMRPLALAVKLRRQFAEPGGSVLGDIYLLNEKNLRGDFTLHVTVKDPAGSVLFEHKKDVTVHGGDLFSERLAEALTLPAAAGDGYCRVEAKLIDSSGAEVTIGRDDFLTVAWKNSALPKNGAVFENNHDIQNFLAQGNGLSVPAFDDSQGALDWLVVGRSPRDELQAIPSEVLVDSKGQSGRITTTFYQGNAFKEQLAQRSDRELVFACPAGAAPDPAVTQIENYGVCWEGQFKPKRTGSYRLALRNNHKGRLYLDGKLVLENNLARGAAQKEVTVDWTEGKPVVLRMEYERGDSEGVAELLWLPPGGQKIDPARFLARAKEGTTLILAGSAEDWMPAVKEATGIDYRGNFKVGTVWLGGQFFVREHPLFRGLPVNVALNWPYQAVVDDHRLGFLIDGEELVAGCWQSTGCQLGTAVGVIPYGKGRIVFSSLNIVPKLRAKDSASLVARKLLGNYIAFAPASTKP